MAWENIGAGPWQKAVLTADFTSAGGIFYRFSAGGQDEVEFMGTIICVTGGVLTGFTVPLAYRPPTDAVGNRSAACMQTNATPGYVAILPSGAVQFASPAAANVCLNGVRINISAIPF